MTQDFSSKLKYNCSV